MDSSRYEGYLLMKLGTNHLKRKQGVLKVEQLIMDLFS